MTLRQKQTLEFIRDYMTTNGGVAPSYDEIRLHLGLVSKSGVHRIIARLKEAGFIKHETGRWRAIQLRQEAA